MPSKEKKSKDRTPPAPVEEDYDRNRRLVEAIAARPENSYCFDCNAHAPRWASINFGVFICLRCSGFHRSLGVHISKVRSVNLDKWSLEQVMHMDAIGNQRGAELYEACRPRAFRKPDEWADDRCLDAYIRAKYEHRAFFPKPPSRRDAADESSEEEPPARKSEGSKRRPTKGKSRAEPEAETAKPSTAPVHDEFAAFGAGPPVNAATASHPTHNGAPVTPGSGVPSHQCRRSDVLDSEFMSFAPPPPTAAAAGAPPAEAQLKSLQDDVFQLFESSCVVAK